MRILFVCLGNICRSPMGEGIMRSLVKNENLQDQIKIDSAGTAAYHIGKLADPRMRATANKHGIELVSRARQFKAADFDTFDIILAMDSSNYSNILTLAVAEEDIQKVKLMRSYDIPEYKNEDVPDPYYGGDSGFENVYQLLERSCKNLLKKIKNEYNL